MTTLSNQILNIQNEAALILKKTLDKANGKITLFDPDKETKGGISINMDTEYEDSDEIYIHTISADDFSPKLSYISDSGSEGNVYAVHLPVDLLAQIADQLTTDPTELDKRVVSDRLFIQEIINSLVKSGRMDWQSKYGTMLRDWSAELRQKAGLKGNTKKTHAKIVGRNLYNN